MRILKCRCVTGLILGLAFLGLYAHAGIKLAFGENGQDQSGKASRPPIVGVAHIGLYTSDVAASRQFYGKMLGFAEPFF